MTPRPDGPRPRRAGAASRGERARCAPGSSSAQHDTAKTLARATRLSQVISVLAGDADYDGPPRPGRRRGRRAVLRRPCGPDARARRGSDGRRATTGCAPRTCRQAPTAVTGPRVAHPPPSRSPSAPPRSSACPIGSGDTTPSTSPGRACSSGEQSLGVLMLARRADEPFERSDGTELRAIGYRIALAMENSLLHRGMSEQLVRLHHIQVLTEQLAGTLELDAVGKLVAEMLVAEVHVAASVLVIDRDGDPVTVAREGWADDAITRELGALPARGGGRARRLRRGRRPAAGGIPRARAPAPPTRPRRAGARQGASLRAEPGARPPRLAHRSARAPHLPRGARGPDRAARTSSASCCSTSTTSSRSTTSTAIRPATTRCVWSPTRCATTRAPTTPSTASAARSSAS